MKNIKDIKTNLIADLYKKSVVYKSQKAILKNFSEKEAQFLAKSNKIFLALKILAHYNDNSSLSKVADLFISTANSFLLNTNNKNKKAILLALHEISSILDSFYLEQIISFENLSIFKEIIIEYTNLIDLIFDEHINSKKETIKFSPADFSTVPAAMQVNSKEAIKDTIKDTMSFINSLKDIKDMNNLDKGHIKDTEEYKGHEDYKGHDIPKKSSKNRVNKSISLSQEKQIQSRRLKIIELLKTYGSLTSSEIHKHIPDISKKTLQRELQSMVEEEILNKEGDKRWTRYSIKI